MCQNWKSSVGQQSVFTESKSAHWLATPLCSFCTSSVTRPCDPAGRTAHRAAAAAAAFSAAVGLLPSRLLAIASQITPAALEQSRRQDRGQMQGHSDYRRSTAPCILIASSNTAGMTETHRSSNRSSNRSKHNSTCVNSSRGSGDMQCTNSRIA